MVYRAPVVNHGPVETLAIEGDQHAIFCGNRPEGLQHGFLFGIVASHQLGQLELAVTSVNQTDQKNHRTGEATCFQVEIDHMVRQIGPQCAQLTGPRRWWFRTALVESHQRMAQPLITMGPDFAQRAAADPVRTPTVGHLFARRQLRYIFIAGSRIACRNARQLVCGRFALAVRSQPFALRAGAVDSIG